MEAWQNILWYSQSRRRKLSTHDREQTTETSKNMNGTQKRNFEWKEADTKEYMARESTYIKFQSWAK